MIINGKQIAQEIIEELKKQPKQKKFLAAILVGEDETSISFLKQKERVAKELGIDFRIYKFSAEIKQDELRKKVLKISQHKICGGVIVQLPLPEHINKHYVCNVIPREKDVDVLGERALGAFYTGRNPVLPPAVGVVEEIIRNLKLEIRNFRIAVIGRGFLIGQPIALWLMDKVAELHVYASQTENLGEKLKDADLIITGVGQPGLIEPVMLQHNTLVIDFGYSKGSQGELRGDFNASSLEIGNSKLEIFYTPTPGGTGPILVAKLFENFYALNR